MVWYDLVWYVMVLVWYGMVRYGKNQQRTDGRLGNPAAHHRIPLERKKERKNMKIRCGHSDRQTGDQLIGFHFNLTRQLFFFGTTLDDVLLTTTCVPINFETALGLELVFAENKLNAKIFLKPIKTSCTLDSGQCLEPAKRNLDKTIESIYFVFGF